MLAFEVNGTATPIAAANSMAQGENHLPIRHILLGLPICYLILCLVLAIVLSELAFRPPRIPLDEQQWQSAKKTVSRLGSALEDVSISTPDARLQAWFIHPPNPNGNAVILLHGVSDNRLGMMPFAELLLANGYAVLVPDSRAQGMSGGDFPTYGLKETGDVRQWFNWVVARQHPPCVFALGESMGGSIALQALRQTPFCAVIAESAFASFRQIGYLRMGQVFHGGAWVGRFALRPAVELAFLYGRITRGINLAAASPERAVAGSRVPILLIHGLADKNIPPQQSERIRDRNPAGISLWEVPRADHCGTINAAYDEFTSRVLGWFAAHGAAAHLTPSR